MKNEIWKDIKNYEGLYQVSNLVKHHIICGVFFILLKKVKKFAKKY